MFEVQNLCLALSTWLHVVGSLTFGIEHHLHIYSVLYMFISKTHSTISFLVNS